VDIDAVAGPRYDAATMNTRRLVLIAAVIVAGCATGPRPSTPVNAGSAGNPQQAAEYRRCSAADPDRFAWFCVIGQVLYSALSSLQRDAALGLR
jgi:hypothetical protein